MHIRGDHAELVVGGRLDVRSAADARTVLHSAVDDGAGDLVLDLTELDSWDATGLGVIMGAHRRAGRAGRRLVLRGVPPQMQRHRGRNRRRIAAARVTRVGPERYSQEGMHNPHETVTSWAARPPACS
jgi:anti-anti-sigma factor